MKTLINEVKFNRDGLVCAIAQCHVTLRVLMVAWMNAEALEKTAQTGYAHYFSRSRQRLWRKGESSGHLQKVHELRLDCDGDAIVMLIEQVGGLACHTGRESCFYRVLEHGTWRTADPVIKPEHEIYTKGKVTVNQILTNENADILQVIAKLIDERKSSAPDTSYVASLMHKGQDVILKKIIEEAGEVLMASKDQDAEHVIKEVADVWFHTLVLLSYHNLQPSNVLAELKRRQNVSGLAEKAARGG